MLTRLFIRRRSDGRIRRWLVLVAVASAVGGVSAAVVAAQASTPPHSPYGAFDALLPTATGFQVNGWTVDPDTTAPTNVGIWINGKGTAQLRADRSRPDVAKAHPGAGDKHGFAGAWSRPEGTYKVCVVAFNLSAGSNTDLGCKTITVDFKPHGAIASVSQYPGGFTASGWAVDPSASTAAVAVDLTIDGKHTARITANAARSGIPAFVPSAGANHGWTIKTAAGEGTHRVCLYAVNIGVGSDATIGCRNVTLNFSPVGAITGLTQRPGGFRVSGWAADPDTSAPVTVQVLVNGTQLATVVANGPSTVRAAHGFDASLLLPGTSLPPGSRTICVVGVNLGSFGTTKQMACQAITLNYNPTAAADAVIQRSPGALITGWATDPDTSAAVNVTISADGKAVKTVPANGAGSSHTGHNFSVLVPLPNGKHHVCATAANLSYGSGGSPAACKDVTLNFNPVGSFESVTRVSGGTSLVVTGWAFDPDTTGTIPIAVGIDGVNQAATKTGVSRPDIAKSHPGTGSTQGFRATYKANDGEHRVCVTAVNVGGGSGNTYLNCRIINAVHPIIPSAPQKVTAVGGYGQATVSWTAPTSDGGAPWTSFVVTSSPGSLSTTVGPGVRTATVTGLKPKTTYTFSVQAVNVAGRSAGGKSPAVTTLASPPPQTTPAPISTSRYIRNIASATATDLATMRAEGAADANANPSGHSYLILLDIGGQTGGGVMLSATTHYVSYGDLVKDVNAYVDGYASKQRGSAPVWIAIGTNNDMDVSSSAGAAWANSVIDPVKAYAAKYGGITVAGANDIEPGFRGTQAQTQSWVSGYLANTSAPFLNNGSADGCAWTATNRGCNNGWTMAGLYNLSAGMASTRIVTLPQIYNTTMPAQWKYISLTGIGQSKPRINFGGPLTEWTACQQAGSCGSLTGNNAWTQMWNQLQSNSALKVGSLPYSTDLRIDR
ncbi:MAG: hypothetical protein QOE97_822 [Pseudonocardiales bacterium]|jgi:hypothetical protein|nr:hypothetical protein [Pseudonocardiales bacterium]